MTYNSVVDIYAANDAARARLEQRVSILSEAEQNLRAAPEAWSVAEIVEHLSIIERQLLKVISMMLTKAEGASARSAASGDATDSSASPAAARAFQPFSLDAVAEAARGQKFQAPETVRPRGDVSIADSLASLRESRRNFRALQPRFEASDMSRVNFPHPVFGALNAYQWLAFVGLHEARHLSQIKTLLDTAKANGGDFI